MKHEIEKQKPADYDVLVTILTDGQENASRKFTGSGIRNIIDELKQQRWVFSYIGANHNIEATAASMGIEHTIRFESEAVSVKSTIFLSLIYASMTRYFSLNIMVWQLIVF